MTEDDINITRRFFTALEMLIAAREIRGKKTLCRRYNILQPNMRRLEREPERYALPPSWLTYLVVDWGFQAKWLLTGKGKMRTKSINKTH